MEPPLSAWESLGSTWQLAIDQAWESWTAGSCWRRVPVLVDEDRISGCERVATRTTEQVGSHLSGTIQVSTTGVDVLSQVPFSTRITGSLHATLGHHLMCAATIAFYRVPEVHYAAADPFFDGLQDWSGQLSLRGQAQT